MKQMRARVAQGAALAVAAGLTILTAAPRPPLPEATAAAAPVSSAEWVKRTASGPAPLAAIFAALTHNPVSNRIVMFGGLDEKDRDTGELWFFDAENSVWQKAAVAGPKPPTAEDQSTLYDPVGHRLLVYGGETDDAVNSLWSLDLKSYRWRNMTTKDAPIREGHTAVYDPTRKRMIVFGGQHDLETDLHTVWTLDLNPESKTFEKWQNETLPAGNPPGRFDHAAVFDARKNRMVVFGGWSKNKKAYFGDTWALNLGGGTEKPQWTQIQAPTRPADRRNASAVYDPSLNLFLLFGGLGKDGALNDVWAFDLTSDAWVQLTPKGAAPAGRSDAEALYDTSRRSVIVYGGVNAGGKVRDMWELKLQ
jgi:hypothetical protein